MKIIDNGIQKIVTTEDYNYIFDRRNGNFARWGRTHKEDPILSNYGPEIFDIEISDHCKGPKGKLCPWCYKSADPHGTNMSFELFKDIIDKIGPTDSQAGVCQVAIGSGATGIENPDVILMMAYCRSKGIIPNITVADISDDTAKQFSKVIGGIAVSCYDDHNVCFDSVKRLTDNGVIQTNIHRMICNENYNDTLDLIHEVKNDPRLEKLNAIVFLSLKQKGRGAGYTPLSQEKFKYLIDICLELGLKFGMDSCSHSKFNKAVAHHPNYVEMEMVSEPCESTLFSLYCNTYGEIFPCSFCVGVDGWESGISVDHYSDFTDIWNHPRILEFRNKLIGKCRNCPIFTV